jgi:hypothetical protein
MSRMSNQTDSEILYFVSAGVVRLQSSHFIIIIILCIVHSLVTFKLWGISEAMYASIIKCKNVKDPV